jgi:hypothetical protein
MIKKNIFLYIININPFFYSIPKLFITMKPTKKARVVKPQSKKKIGKPLSKFTKVQSSSTLSKLEDTGKNFYEAGKEVANKGTELLKQISAVPEKGLSEVVKMAIKA